MKKITDFLRGELGSVLFNFERVDVVVACTFSFDENDEPNATGFFGYSFQIKQEKTTTKYISMKLLFSYVN